MKLHDTIVALATPAGAGAIAVIRVSGKEAVDIVAPLFQAKGKKDLREVASHTLHLGHLMDEQRIIDEVLVSVFHGPRSYTGENTIEISCHGSPYIQQEVIQLLVRKGCRSAEAGEFTLRSFLNGKMDLSQAEAVADLISSENEASHQLAMQQMRGGFSNEIKKLREELLNFASLIELELDFAEEDVEFANRDQFTALVLKIQKVLQKLVDSFSVGNVIKHGIPVAIVGEPNVGKSTLLNALLNEERAIVSEIAGTTRDTIEDEISIGGIGFRFIDTAGIRETKDVVESIGIKRTFEKIGQSQVVIYLVDSSRLKLNIQDSAEADRLDARESNETRNSKGHLNEETSSERKNRNEAGTSEDHLDDKSVSEGKRSLAEVQTEIEKIKNKFPQKPLIVVANKVDQLTEEQTEQLASHLGEIQGAVLQLLSAKTGTGVDELQDQLLKFVNTGALRNNNTIVTNSRHYESLLKALEEINKVQEGLNMGLSGDLLAIDIRQALYHFGEITGEITNDDLLGNIFANFCIGK